MALPEIIIAITGRQRENRSIGKQKMIETRDKKLAQARIPLWCLKIKPERITQG
jgi:hypothetical protein